MLFDLMAVKKAACEFCWVNLQFIMPIDSSTLGATHYRKRLTSDSTGKKNVNQVTVVKNESYHIISSCYESYEDSFL